MNTRAYPSEKRIRQYTARILVAAILAAGSLAAHAADPSEKWAASWYTAQADYLEGMPPTYPAPAVKTLSNQTIRQIVYVSAAGSKVRLKLSNQFGDAPVTFDSVTIAANTGSAASIDAARFLDRIDLVAFESSFLRGDFDLSAPGVDGLLGAAEAAL